VISHTSSQDACRMLDEVIATSNRRPAIFAMSLGHQRCKAGKPTTTTGGLNMGNIRCTSLQESATDSKSASFIYTGYRPATGYWRRHPWGLTYYVWMCILTYICMLAVCHAEVVLMRSTAGPRNKTKNRVFVQKCHVPPITLDSLRPAEAHIREALMQCLTWLYYQIVIGGCHHVLQQPQPCKQAMRFTSPEMLCPMILSMVVPCHSMTIAGLKSCLMYLHTSRTTLGSGHDSTNSPWIFFFDSCIPAVLEPHDRSLRSDTYTNISSPHSCMSYAVFHPFFSTEH